MNSDDTSGSHSPLGPSFHTAAAAEIPVPRPWVTQALIAINVLIYTAMVAATHQPFAFAVEDLRLWGGNFAPAISEGELWRVFTAMFLHAGIIHLGMNMWVLMAIGPLLERLFGVTTFLLLYVLAGLAGNVFGMLWHPLAVGVGASGAIFGLYGALMGFLFIRRNVIPAEVLRTLMQNGLYFLGINLVLGFSIPGVDVAAHLFGAAGGLIGGIIASCFTSQHAQLGWWMRNATLASLCVAALAAAPLLVPASTGALSQYLDAVQYWGQQEDVVLERYNSVIEESQQKEMSSREFASKLELEVLNPWSELRQRFPPLGELPPSVKSAPLAPKVYAYLEAMEESFKLLIRANRTDDEHLGERAAKKLEEAQSLADQMRQLNK